MCLSAAAPRLVLGAIYKYLNEPLQVSTHLLLLRFIAASVVLNMDSFLPLPQFGGAGGSMFSCRPSVCVSVRPSVTLYFHNVCDIC